MKLIHVLAATVACATACSHSPEPQTAHVAPSTMPTQTALVATAEPTEARLAPGAPTIPSASQVPPPVAPASKPADVTPLTSASLASPRAGSVPEVPMDPALDKPETSGDEESVREIRALLAADKSLSATARKVTVVARSGRVRLSGQVNTVEERAAIERAARKAAGVIDVKNQLVVLE